MTEMSPEKDGKALPKALVQDEEVGMPNAAGKKQPGNYLLLAGFLMSVALVSIFANAGLSSAATPSSRRALSTFEDAFDGEPKRHPLRQLGKNGGSSGAKPSPSPPPPPSPPLRGRCYSVGGRCYSQGGRCYSVGDDCLNSAGCAPSACLGNLVCVQSQRAGFWDVYPAHGTCQASGPQPKPPSPPPDSSDSSDCDDDDDC